MDVAFLVPEALRLMDESAGSRDSFIIARVLKWQFLAGAALAAVIWGVFGHIAGYSVLLGSLIAVIPNAFLGLRLVLPRRDPGAGALLRAAWLGELGKLALTVLFFSLVFMLVRPLSGAALFAGFIVTQLMTFAGFWVQGEQETETSNSNGS